jgi:hypothetical protein
MTAMYNVVELLRAGTPLSDAEREIHSLGACGILRDLHDELDALVAEAYGWPWPLTPTAMLERLVSLHDRRAEEEAAGTVHWLRPDFQRARFSRVSKTDAGAASDGGPEPSATVPLALEPWPTDAIGQITALRALATTAPVSAEEAMLRFAGARRDLVVRHLETLAILGELHAVGDGHYVAPAAVPPPVPAPLERTPKPPTVEVRDASAPVASNSKPSKARAAKSTPRRESGSS